MAGTVTTTEVMHSSVQKIKFAWVSSAGGAADGTTTNYLTGQIVGAVFVPGSGADQPTDQYDVTIVDSDGNDVLAGQGANLSNAAPVYKLAANMTACVESKLTLGVTNAGNAKSGTIYLFVR